jgi:hypothetical protein
MLSGIMYSAVFHIKGSNYEIETESIRIPDMRAEIDRIAKFVHQRGGSKRGLNEHHYKDQNFGPGYHNALRFNAEFFLEGVIISLYGENERDSRFLVNPMRSNLMRDLRSPNGVCLADVPEYTQYSRDYALGLNERVPQLTDSGTMSLTLEGAVRHLAAESPDFYALTGLPQQWQPGFKLLTLEQYNKEKAEEEARYKEERDKAVTMFVLSRRKKEGMSKAEAMELYPYKARENKDIFDSVFGPDKKDPVARKNKPALQ